MKLVSAEEMRAIDNRAINEYKIPSLDLMENAGRGIFNYTNEFVLPQFHDPAIAVICGRGNNGGDGFVIGRYLYENGYNASFILAGTDEKLSDDCRVNYDKVTQAGHEVILLSSEDNIPDLSEYDVIIDAIFGTGFAGVPRGITATVIDAVNTAERFVIAVDAPSGLDVSTGLAEDVVVEADVTTTLALPKPGLYVSPGREYSGTVTVIPIGIPNEVIASFDLRANLVTGEQVALALPTSKPDGHKGDFGKVIILAGSPGLTGAACLSGLAAARSGAGLVTVGVPRSLNAIIESKLTEVMSIPLPDVGKKSVLALRGKGEIKKHIAERDAVAIGPGLGRHHETCELIRRLISDIDIPIVIDADGLYPLGGDDSPLLKNHAPMVLTPHPGEFARLTGETTDEIQINNFDMVAGYAQKFDSVIVLKGSPTIIASPDGEIFVTPTGNFGMATGGSGDVLTGIIVALLGQQLSPVEAAVCGVFMHGLTGDIAIGDINPRSLIAGDLIDYLSAAFDALEV
ncbi:MAG: NAD(P)H-hydrate dehydratase [candidate division Zixibacteria bacterium]|nr:NAD(P)H-hydrate dehydratase [candidate division Zixibacteria bacterium]